MEENSERKLMMVIFENRERCFAYKIRLGAGE